MDISKLESIFQDIWENEADQKKPARPYDNHFQKWVFWLMVDSLGLGLLIALSTKIFISENQKLFSLLFVVLSQVLSLVYQLSIIFQSVRVLKAPTRHFLEPVTASAAKDYQLAYNMQRFNLSQLNYALARLRLEVAQIRSRVGILIGAVEKVGIVPVALTTAFSAYGYFADGKIAFEQVDWVVYALMGLYVSVLPVLFFSHKLDRYALVVDTAIKLKQSNANNSLPQTAASGDR